MVVTIILLLILVGVVLTLTLGQNGIINLAKNARNEYENAERNEIRDLDKLYSSIKIANGSTITLTQEELDEYIKTKASPTGLRTDAYIRNRETYYQGSYTVTSMTGFTRTADENNNIKDYLSYSETDGYTVQKNGWYFIKMESFCQSSKPADLQVFCYLNSTEILRTWSYTDGSDHWASDNNSSTIYLKQGDKIYFKATGTGPAGDRYADCYIYPMF